MSAGSLVAPFKVLQSQINKLVHLEPLCDELRSLLEMRLLNEELVGPHHFFGSLSHFVGDMQWQLGVGVTVLSHDS